MIRFTERMANGDARLIDVGPGDVMFFSTRDRAEAQKAIERLCEYEETGLLPDEIKEMKGDKADG